MSEFNNRVAAQREILSDINHSKWKEELFGLSSGAIDRWINVNRLEASSVLVELIRQTAEKLFFSQIKAKSKLQKITRVCLVRYPF